MRRFSNIYLRAYRKFRKLKNKGAKTPTWRKVQKVLNVLRFLSVARKLEAVVSKYLLMESIEQVAFSIIG